MIGQAIALLSVHQVLHVLASPEWGTGLENCTSVDDLQCPIRAAREVAKNSNTDHLLLQLERRFGQLTRHNGSSQSCCNACGNSGFCSPQSGNCYTNKNKDYYFSCTSCCSSCGGSGFCSPRSGNCYSSQSKHYYQSCSTDGGSASCCSSCGGSGFCSPRSGNCYGSKSKHYYQSCSTDGGLAPPPSPSPVEGGLVPPPAPPSAGCCSGCDAFCSPLSSSCYETKRKPYYLTCNGAAEPAFDRLVWADDFDDVNGDGTVNSSKWAYKNGPNPHNQELQYYTSRPDNSYVRDGKLTIVAKCEDYGGRRRMHYTSARLVTEGIAEWGPGHRIEVRAKNPVARGAWPAIWMMPASNVYGGWPHSGEIDIMESVGCTRGSVYGTVHTGAYNHMTGTQKGRKYPTDESDWHIYSIEWEDTHIHWFVDGVHYNTFAPDDLGNSAKWPFNQPFYLILNVAVGGSWGGFCMSGGPSCRSGSEFAEGQVMEFDYVRVYASSGTSELEVARYEISG